MPAFADGMNRVAHDNRHTAVLIVRNTLGILFM